ncbi:M23 family metallopeptidase [Streptomyces sp. 1222.5]|uniref:M23 family metallopeptidase n=1 Tax=Streptomyces sp. 1222.5 TaxID=1881026 RepID=UPI003D746D4A
MPLSTIVKPTGKHRRPSGKIPLMAQRSRHSPISMVPLECVPAISSPAVRRRSTPQTVLELLALALALFILVGGVWDCVAPKSGGPVSRHTPSTASPSHPKEPKRSTPWSGSPRRISATSAYSALCNLPQNAIINVMVTPPGLTPRPHTQSYQTPSSSTAQSVFVYYHPSQGYVAGCYGDIQVGRKNDSIRILQWSLIDHRRPIPSGATGLYGRQTSVAYWSHVSALWPGPTSHVAPVSALSSLGLLPATQVKVQRMPSPVPGAVVSWPYGMKDSHYSAGFHTGTDFAAPSGTPVLAILPGVIEWANQDGEALGKWIGLRAGNGRLYVYAHLSVLSVDTGDMVTAGQIIGNVGQTGNAKGPHLHLEDHPPGPYKYADTRRPQW